MISGQKRKLTTAEALATRSLNLPRPSAVPSRHHYSSVGRRRNKKKDALVGMKTLVMVCHCVLNEAKGIPDDNEVFKAVIHEKLEVKMKRKTRL